jgi:ABC-2 type transport system permease protein
MIGSFRAELLRLRRWPVTWVLIGVWLVLSLATGYVFSYSAYRSADDATTAETLLARIMPDNAPTALLQGMPLFGGALLLILGALTIGSGYGWGTWKTVFTIGPRRHTALVGTLGALGVVVVGVVLATFALSLAASAVIAGAEAQPVSWPSIADSAQGVGAGLLILGMWTAGGVLLGTLVRNPAMAVGLGLVWALAVENLLLGVSSLFGPVERLTEVLPGTAAGSLAGALGALPGSPSVGGTPGVMLLLDGAPAAILLSGYLAVFLLVSVALTMRREIPA